MVKEGSPVLLEIRPRLLVASDSRERELLTVLLTPVEIAFQRHTSSLDPVETTGTPT
jgi:hypothetical protein